MVVIWKFEFGPHFLKTCLLGWLKNQNCPLVWMWVSTIVCLLCMYPVIGWRLFCAKISLVSFQHTRVGNPFSLKTCQAGSHNSKKGSRTYLSPLVFLEWNIKKNNNNLVHSTTVQCFSLGRINTLRPCLTERRRSASVYLPRECCFFIADHSWSHPFAKTTILLLCRHAVYRSPNGKRLN